MWYAIYEKLTGKLKSVGTVISDPIRPAYKALKLGEDFDQTGKVWDEKIRQFINRPDPIIETTIKEGLKNIPELAKLTDVEKNSLFSKLAILIERGILQ